VIFSRGRGSARRRKRPDPNRGNEHRHEEGGESADLGEDGAEAQAGPGVREHAGGTDWRLGELGSEVSFGPYDITEAPDDGVERLDLGSLRIPAIKDVEIHLQAGAEGEIQQVLLVYGESRLQLAVFAAPRTESIWDELRAELRSTLSASGSRPEEIEGEYGPELRARQREAGRASDVRFVGVEGPRWLVQGVYRGAAAADPDRAGPLREALRGLVVDRGPQAMPVREALPLRLPPEAVEGLGESVVTDDAAQAGGRVNGAAAKPAGRRSAPRRRER
jgi:hypothetical protein